MGGVGYRTVLQRPNGFLFRFEFISRELVGGSDVPHQPACRRGSLNSTFDGSIDHLAVTIDAT
jgi:hypothetical protein